ncbi:MAG: HAMP domain-containing sensor histidine kinase [Oscillospiraceae bacterium]
MQKSIFGKYFSIFLGVILVSIVILGTMLIFFASQYFRETQQNSLFSYAKSAAIETQKRLNYTDGKKAYLDPETMKDSFNILTASANIDIILSDMNGKSLISSGENKENFHLYVIPVEILDATYRNESYRNVTNLDRIYKSPHYVVSYPVVDIDKSPIGLILATSNTANMNKFLFEILKIFIISSISVVVLASVLIYFVTNKIVEPLRQMADASIAFAKGDFSKRVPVESYDEVGQLSLAFNNMASSLCINEEMRRSFVANVSHELKTPMTTIGGFVDGILDGTIPQENQNKYLKIVSNEVKRLSRLVLSMLNIARIEAGEMKITPTQFNIMDSIYSTVFSLEKQINEKKLDVRGLDVDKKIVYGDIDLLYQVIYNLVDNAIKFSNEGGYIEFNVYGDNNSIFISIKNTGKGITKEQSEKIFERFYKADKSRSIDKNGVGLGLYIVKSIITMHNGDIAIRSKENEFCEFIFSLPKTKGRNTNKKQYR